jgi:GTP-binding protein LepA
MSAQVLDSMDPSASAASPSRRTQSGNYEASDGKTYILNLIDTPSHVDFSYEVTGSLAACEGACCSSTRPGCRAQTGQCYLAVENNLEIIPVINKIDLPAQPEEAMRQLEDIIGSTAMISRAARRPQRQGDPRSGGPSGAAA